MKLGPVSPLRETDPPVRMVRFEVGVEYLTNVNGVIFEPRSLQGGGDPSLVEAMNPGTVKMADAIP